MKSDAFALLCAAVLTISCSSSDTGVTPTNQPPTISWGFRPIGVGRLTTPELSVSVDDPDEDDVLSVDWSVTRGALTPIAGSNGTRVRWSVPDVVGVDTVRVTVSDGEMSASVTEEIKVGTLISSESFDGNRGASLSPYILSPIAGTINRVTTSLSIQEGVELLMDLADASLVVEGVMTVQGTVDNPVVIRPNDRTLRCQSERGWWKGIEAVGTSNITMDYVNVTYGVKNLRLTQQSSATLNDCQFKCSSEAGVEISSTGTLTMDGCVVSNNASSGVSVASFSLVPQAVHVTNCEIIINGNTGMRMELNDAAQSSDIVVELNRFEFNFTHGILLTRQVFPKIHNNHFESNGLSGGLSNIRLQTPYPAGVPFDTLDATQNYWGGSFTNQADVDGTIHDSLDDSQIGTRVKVNPWLNSSPLP